MNGRRDLVLAASAAALCGLIVLLVPLEGVRLAAAIPLALLLPGYGLTAAVFGQRPLWGPQALLLSLGMSLATLAVGGLGLNYLPGGLRATSWTVLLVLVVVCGCVVASRRSHSPASNRLRAPGTFLIRTDRPVLVGSALALAASAVLAASALASWWKPLPAKNAIGYTQLWMLPGGSGRAALRIGVLSQEQHSVSYRLKVSLGRRQALVSSPLSSPLELRPGQRRVFRLRVSHWPESPIPVTALLFRDDDPNRAYRRVTGWVSGA